MADAKRWNIDYYKGEALLPTNPCNLALTLDTVPCAHSRLRQRQSGKPEPRRDGAPEAIHGVSLSQRKRSRFELVAMR